MGLRLEQIDPAELELTHLLEDHTTLMVPANHQVARRRKVEMSELADEDWIEREHDHPVVAVLERSCRAAAGGQGVAGSNPVVPTVWPKAR
jgi:DNA-binding transcriptional LysR family regulator